MRACPWYPQTSTKSNEAKMGILGALKAWSSQAVSYIQRCYWARFSSRWAQRWQLQWTAAEPQLGGGAQKCFQLTKPQARLKLPLPLQVKIGTARNEGRRGGAERRKIEQLGGRKTPWTGCDREDSRSVFERTSAKQHLSWARLVQGVFVGRWSCRNAKDRRTQ